MPTNYLTPGVYIEEDLSPRGGSGYGDARAIAAFVGVSDKGPAQPTLVTSWNQYQLAFGGFSSNSLLPFAVNLFFQNGGGRCYVVRATRSDAVAATVTLKDSTPAEPDDGPLDALRITALSPGVGGNTMSVQVIPTGTPGRFHFLVLDAGAEVERFEDLSVDPGDSRYAISILNSPFAGSRVLKVVNLKATSDYVYNATTDVLPSQTATLGSGADGSAPYDFVAATKLLEDLDVNVDINLPGVTATSVLNPILTWAKATGKAFLVIDGPKGAENATSAQVLAGYTAMVTGVSPLEASSNGALYGPWLMCADPSTSMYGAIRLLPPGGAVLGRYAVNDATRHAGKAPAGVETRLAGVRATETRFLPSELDTAAENHINIIRNVPNHGICIMGARTLKLELPDRYVPVRRLLILLGKQLADISRFAVFEPNGPDLWLQVTLRLTRYLSILRRATVLAGQTDAQAFFVKCDADNNPQSQINAGRLNIDVGLAFLYPAEFVIIRIGQHIDGATDVSELIPGITN